MQLCAITDRRRLPGARRRGGAEEAADLRRLAAQWIAGGVDYIQLREKDLDPRSLRALAEKIFLDLDRGHTRLLINFSISPASGRALRDAAALAAIADGLHLPGPPEPGAVERVRRIFSAEGRQGLVSLSCHTLEEIGRAREERPDFILFAPVFEKSIGEKTTGEKTRGGDPPREKISGGDASGREKKIAGKNLASERMDSEEGIGAEEARGAAAGLDGLRLAAQAAGGAPVLALGGITSARAAACVAAGARGVAGIRLFMDQSGEGWRRLLSLDGAAAERPSAQPRIAATHI